MKYKSILCRLVHLGLVLAVSVTSTVYAENLTESQRGQIISAMTLTELGLDNNKEAVKILLQQCLEEMQEDETATTTINSALLLLEMEKPDAQSVNILLSTLIDKDTEDEGKTEVSPQKKEEIFNSGQSADTNIITLEYEVPEIFKNDLPIYEVQAFIETIFKEPVILEVPENWGNNASGRAVTSFSSVNKSGAISPAGGTLTISYFEPNGNTEKEALNQYENDMASLSMVSGFSAEEITVAGITGSKMDFLMNAGANSYTCETVAFVYNDLVYSIEILQGKQTEYDFYPMFCNVLSSTEVAADSKIAQILNGETTEPNDVDELIAEISGDDTMESDMAQKPDAEISGDNTTESNMVDKTDTEVQLDGIQNNSDIGTFMYELNGHVYEFPTRVSNIQDGDIPLQRNEIIPYDFSSDADMMEGRWTEIINTQYYCFDSDGYKEMAGVTNLDGRPSAMNDCMLTSLVDTNGSKVNITLPGDIQVGDPESAIYNGFPEFNGMALDGNAAFRANELLYACNVRDDGCDGYVLIKNDDPYYSAVSIICENNIIKEICYECIGSVRAEGVFLEE